jgi:hypothetical protein
MLYRKWVIPLAMLGWMLMVNTLYGSNDTTAIQKAVRFLSKGHFAGHLRQYSMITLNDADLTDFAGVAAGGGLHYTSPAVKGLQIGFSGFFISYYSIVRYEKIKRFIK